MGKRFLTALVPCLLLMVLHAFRVPFAPVWGTVLATFIVFGPGLWLLKQGVDSLKNRSLNMFTLVTLGVCCAYFFSLAAVLFPGAVPPEMCDENGRAHLYFDAAAMIVTLVLLGQYLDRRVQQGTESAIRALLHLSPEQALRLRPDGSAETVPLTGVRAGDVLRILPGASVPADGLVLRGSSHLDESMLTGESRPVSKSPGDALAAGTVNGEGVLEMETLKLGAETLLGRIIAMVEEARNAKAPVRDLTDRVSAVFVPVVIGIAVLTAVLWTVCGHSPSLALVCSISVLLSACPCVLGLAAPLAVTAAAGAGARRGILFRDPAVMERLYQVQVLFLDKTGTLTTGQMEMSEAVPAPGRTQEELIRTVCSLENASSHPLGRSVRRYAGAKGIVPEAVSGFRQIPGSGVQGTIGGVRVLAGSRNWMLREGIDLAPLAPVMDAWEQRGSSLIVAARDGQLLGVWEAADHLREEAPSAVSAIRKRGIETVLLTGDHGPAARHAADRCGISKVIADALPERKFAEVREARRSGLLCAMAGDGVNDAAALAEADAGIAISGGTDAAISSASVTLLAGGVERIAEAMDLSRALAGNVRLNLCFAFCYNLLILPLAAGGLIPFLGWSLTPVWGSCAMCLSSVCVACNAMRLNRFQATGKKRKEHAS